MKLIIGVKLQKDCHSQTRAAILKLYYTKIQRHRKRLEKPKPLSPDRQPTLENVG
jgi:hypothetical protein